MTEADLPVETLAESAAPPPELAAPELTAEEQAEAREYGRVGLICDLLDRGLDILYLTLMAFIGAPLLVTWLSSYPWFVDNRVLQVAAVFLLTIGLHALVSLPLSFYAGHLVERRFGLSNQTAARWARRYAVRMMLSAVFGMLLFLGLYEIIWHVGRWWWLVAAGAFFAVSVLLGQLAPVLIMPLFYKIELLTEDALRARLERLAAGTGLNISGVYRIVLSAETSKANAMLAGLGSTRRVLLGDTVLENFSPAEIDVIFAHEIGHHVHRHIFKLMLWGVMGSLAGFWLCDVGLMSYAQTKLPGVSHENLPAVTVPLVMLLITLFSQVTEPLQNALSRHFERQSDRYALERTGEKAAYQSAFRKLARLNKDDPDPHPLEVLLFHSHPPIRDRLAAADLP